MQKLSDTLLQLNSSSRADKVMKAFESIVSKHDEIQKGGNKDFASLGVMSKQVVRNGTTYNAKFYVDTPDKSKEKNMRDARQGTKENERSNAENRAASHSQTIEHPVGSKVFFMSPSGKSKAQVKKLYSSTGIAIVSDASGKTFAVPSNQLKKAE